MALSTVQVYSVGREVSTLELSEDGRAETDFLQIRNIDGLDPVKASVNTSPLGSIDGTQYVGSSVADRNIVLTLHPNPDYNVWGPEDIRKLLYEYFIPKSQIRMVFTSDDDTPDVEIYGIVEDVQGSMFGKDPELIVSIICPDPYFTAVDPVVWTGKTHLDGTTPIIMDYDANIETGLYLKVTFAAGQPAPATTAVQIGNPMLTYFAVSAVISATAFFEMSSVPGSKYIQGTNLSTAVIGNLLGNITAHGGSLWPILKPGKNNVSIITNVGAHDYTLSYLRRYGGL